MKSEDIRRLMNSLRDFLNCDSASKLSKQAASTLIDNLLELDTLIETSELANVSSMDLVETYRLLEECNEVETSLHPFICALWNKMREYLAPKGLLECRTSHNDESYGIARQNSVMRNVSRKLMEKPKGRSKAELSELNEDRLNRTADMLIIRYHRQKANK
jgi:hypothetical protein